jgi:hypothetical protein
VTVTTLDTRATSALTHSGRTALIARAKAVALPVTCCVAGSLRPDHLLAGWSADELAALVIVLAEAVDPSRLRAVVEAQEDSSPVIGLALVRLRQAHAEYRRLRRTGTEIASIPQSLRRLEREYQRDSKRRQKARP